MILFVTLCLFALYFQGVCKHIFRINWGDGPAEQVLLDANGVEVPQEGEVANVANGDPDSMMEPPPTSSFKDVHSMDESSNVEMEMAF